MDVKIFDCKEGCGEKVEYKRKVVRGLRDVAGEPKTKTVYLTCPQGHTHAYRVEG